MTKPGRTKKAFDFYRCSHASTLEQIN